MTDTLERTDTTVDELVDFSPQCCLLYTNGMRDMVGIKPKQCENPAVWVGFTKCCGVDALVCEPHRWNHNRIQCSCGRMHDDLIGWRKL